MRLGVGEIHTFLEELPHARNVTSVDKCNPELWEANTAVFMCR